METKFVETITLTRESYDELCKEANKLIGKVEYLEKMIQEKQVEINNSKRKIECLEDYTITCMVKDNEYYTKPKSTYSLKSLLDDKYYILKEDYSVLNKLNIECDKLKNAITKEYLKNNPQAKDEVSPSTTIADEIDL